MDNEDKWKRAAKLAENIKAERINDIEHIALCSILISITAAVLAVIAIVIK